MADKVDSPPSASGSSESEFPDTSVEVSSLEPSSLESEFDESDIHVEAAEVGSNSSATRNTKSQPRRMSAKKNQPKTKATDKSKVPSTPKGANVSLY